MAKIGLPKGSGKRLKVSEKSGNFEMDIEWQPCSLCKQFRYRGGLTKCQAWSDFQLTDKSLGIPESFC